MRSVFREIFWSACQAAGLLFTATWLLTGVATSLVAAPPAGYYLVWGDEFNAAALDTTKWDYWLLGSRRDAVNVANAVSLNGSNLVITTYTSNSVNYTAMIATDGTFRSRYGYWEASIKWGDTNGMWSAFWMQSPTMGAYLYDPFVSGSEIDIVEHRSTDGGSNGNIINQVQNNIHWNGYGSSAASAGSGNIGSGLGSGFHTYGFWWTPGTAATSIYTLYVDGGNLRSWSYANNSVPVSQSSEWMILSCEVDDTSTTWAGTIPSGGYGSLAASTTKMTVDYIRYYAPTNNIFWTGSSSADLTRSANYISTLPPLATSDLIFSQLSGNNLSPTLGGNLSVDSLVFTWMNNGATIGGTNTLTLGAGGVDMIAANHSVTLSCPVNLGAAQTWLVGPNSPGNTLTDSGGISGSATLSKGSYGTLILSGTNTFTGTLSAGTGSTSANDGNLRLASSAAVANAASPITIPNNNSGSATLQFDGSSAAVNITQNISLAGRNTNVVAIANYAGSNTLAGGLALQVGGANYWLDSDSGTLNFAGAVPASTPGGTRTLTFMGAANILISGTLQNGTGGGIVNLVKTNAGTLTINHASSYTGTTTLAQGILQANAPGAFGSSVITADSGANSARIILGNGAVITNTLIANSVNSGGGSIGLVMVNDNTSATWSGPITFNANSTAGGHFAGPTTSGLLTISGAVNSGATNFLVIRAGNLRFSGGGSYGEIQPRANTTSLGANNGLAVNATLDIGGNGSASSPTSFDLNGFNQTLAGLKNAVTPANVAWVTNSAATTNTLTLNLGSTNFSFGGSIVGKIALTLNSGAQTLTKSGTTSLNGLYIYAGNTTVNGGTLALGSGMTLPNTPAITVASGGTLDVSASGLTLGAAQTLAGVGTVLGSLTVNGTLAPGNGGVGVLTCSNNVTLNGGSTNYLELSAAAGTNDVLRVAGTLNYGGKLFVTNLSGSLTGGNTFKLFSAGSSSGNFTALAGSPGAGLDWKINPTNGVLTVYATIATNLTVTVTNGALRISWPADHVGWTLQAQTNTLSAGLGTNWVPILNSANNTQFTAPLAAANPAVFYRLIYQ